MTKLFGMALVIGLLVTGGARLVQADDFPTLTPMSTDQLERSSGKQGLPVQWQLNDTEQSAIVSDNVLSGNVATGDNRITDQAFQNMSGIATVIQNTGNQVVIQDSTQINVHINQ